jgi:hypothetical protein
MSYQTFCVLRGLYLVKKVHDSLSDRAKRRARVVSIFFIRRLFQLYETVFYILDDISDARGKKFAKKRARSDCHLFQSTYMNNSNRFKVRP